MVDTYSLTVSGEQSKADGVLGAQRAGKTGESIVGDAHAKYYEGASRGRFFFSYGAPQTLTAVNTTYTGHALYNPVGSGVNLVLSKVSVVVSVTSASMTGIVLASNIQTITPTGTTAIERQGNCKIGAAAGAILAYKAATLQAAGTALFPVMHNTAAINTVGVDQLVIDLDGSIIIQPGYTIHLAALGAASAASAVSSGFIWEEVPII